MLDTLFKWLVYLALVAGILYLGWDEPLRYRFMSRVEIDEIEHPKVEEEPTPTPPPPKPGHWMWDSDHQTTLDKPNRNPTQKSRKSLDPMPYRSSR